MPAVLSTLTHRKSSESMKEAVGILVSFPPEIISLVLQLMGEDFGRERQNFRLVCRSWDYLISHTSLLWKYIFIDKHSINGPADSKDAFSGTCMALERSGNTHPINLTIILPNDGDNDIHSSRFTVEHATLLASIIFPYTGRIASLCVQGNSHDHYLAALRNTFKLPMPLLRRAILIRDDGLLRPGPDPYYFYDLNTEPNPYPSILQCPQSQDPTVVDEWGMNHYPVLEHLSIVGVPFDYSRFPACNLTELRLVRREWEGNGNESNAQHIVRLLLLCCKTLEVLEVVDFPLDANYHTEDVLDFLKLRSFSFGYRRVHHGVFAFLHNILIDNITELILTNTNVLASLDAGVTPSQRQEIISSAEKEDRLVIAEIMGTGQCCTAMIAKSPNSRKLQPDFSINGVAET